MPSCLGDLKNVDRRTVWRYAMTLRKDRAKNEAQIIKLEEENKDLLKKELRCLRIYKEMGGRMK